jgi:hypothetical protein
VATLQLAPKPTCRRYRRCRLSWHLARVEVLSTVLDRAQLDDLVVDTTMLDAQQVAAEIHHAAGWSTFTLGDIAA